MNPINYTSLLNAENPFDATLKGFAANNTMRNAIYQRQQQEYTDRLKLQEQAQKQAMTADLTALAQTSNPTGGQYIALMTKYPSLAPGLKPAHDALNEQQKQNMLNQMTKINTAVLKGRTDIAMDELKSQEQAYRNAGDTKTADTLAGFYDQFKDADPAQAKIISGMITASIMGADKYDQAYSNITKARNEQELLPAQRSKAVAEAVSLGYKAQADAYSPLEARAKATSAEYQAMADVNKPAVSAAEAKIKGYEATNTPIKQQLDNKLTIAQTQDYQSKIQDRKDQSNFNKDQLTTQTQVELKKLNTNVLNNDTRKLINESVKTAVESNKSADTLSSLADRFDALKPVAGTPAVLGVEAWKKVVGDQNKITELRTDAERLINSEVIRSLPPGPSTDKDIQIFKKGFPSADADPVYLASYFRGMVKVRRLEASISSNQAKWLKAVGDLGSTPQDIEIAGITVQAGGDFETFMKAYTTKLFGSNSSAPTKQDNIKTLRSRSYLTDFGR